MKTCPDKEHNISTCQGMLLPVQDSLEVLSGKWKILILVSLLNGTKRFKEISKDLNSKITDKILSKELKEMEANKLLTRTVYDSFPPTVEYAITTHGKSLKKVIAELAKWGMMHREEIGIRRQESGISKHE